MFGVTYLINAKPRGNVPPLAYRRASPPQRDSFTTQAVRHVFANVCVHLGLIIETSSWYSYKNIHRK
ncbi:hypothetical protein J1614_003711 [Plenodomus biglobosus]|nr:hypothetical protein J1614_003711 [Plenodomus biglobosus]